MDNVSLPLPGLDGSNPLAFLAALGVLNAVSESSPRSMLTWELRGTWRPVLVSAYGHIDAVIDYLDADRQSCARDPALRLEYEGKRDLKPRPNQFREFLKQLAHDAAPGARRSVDWVSAFATDIAVDNNGNIKPTALHFTAGQQQFLQMAGELVRLTTADDLREALVGPWQYGRALPVMGWDSTISRDYALRASDPSTDKKLGVPGADWLAIRGLAMVPAVPKGTRILTTGCSGGWKDGRFCWPLWTARLTAASVRSLLRGQVNAMRRAERDARGIGAVFSSGIRRSDQGGYGSFEPASVE
jgi:hypothetical protein